MTPVKEEKTWMDIVAKMLADKVRIEAHYANPASGPIDDIKFVQPLPVLTYRISKKRK